VNQPSILLADEPTGNLDSRTSVEVMEILQSLNEHGLTIVLVTHEHDIAQFAKRNIIFRDGKIRRDEPVMNRARAAAVLKNHMLSPSILAVKTCLKPYGVTCPLPVSYRFLRGDRHKTTIVRQ